MSEKRIKELEQLLKDRDSELSQYKGEIKKLNERLRELIGQISNEIKMAQVIQRTLVPTEIPAIPGFDFSQKFVASFLSGGDYFDIFEHDDKFRFGIIVSSSSGYGMSSLFLSVLMRLSSKIEARRGSEPGVALFEMIKELIPAIQPEDSADVFYGVVDRRTYELSFALLGDVSALLYSHHEGGIVRLKSVAQGISKNFSGEIPTLKVGLNSRDRLILCTRGIVEAKNASGEMFGLKRLEDLLFKHKSSSVHDLRNEILYQAEKFSGKSEPDRDQTAVVVEAKEKVIKLARS